jgi:hypothetical protein
MKEIPLTNSDQVAKEAADAYNLASRKYFGKFGYQNDLEAINV